MNYRYVYMTLCATVFGLGIAGYQVITHRTQIVAAATMIAFLVGLAVGAYMASKLQPYVLGQKQLESGWRTAWPLFVFALAIPILYFTLPVGTRATRLAATVGGAGALIAGLWIVIGIQTLRIERRTGKRIFRQLGGFTLS